MINLATRLNIFQNQSILPTGESCRIRHLPLKRIFDICFSVLVLVMLSPLYIFIALLIKLTTTGSIIFSHERIGRGGKAFKCYKFRSMHADAEERLNCILEENPEIKKEWESTQKLKNDPRITSIGKILRKTSLDELPQFWNVLIGDLSVVGPRPVVYNELVTHFGTKATKILSIRPGITGMWQVSGRSDTTYKTRILMDETYVDTQSFAMDLKLILKTIPVMILSKGAY